MGTDGVAQQGSGIRHRRPQEGHRTDRFRAPCGTLRIGGEALGRSEPALRHGDPGADGGHQGVLGPPAVLAVVTGGACAGRLREVELPAAPQDQRQSTQSEPLDQRVIDTTGVFLAPGEVIGRRIELERAVALQTGRELDPGQDRRVVDLAAMSCAVAAWVDDSSSCIPSKASSDSRTWIWARIAGSRSSAVSR